MCYPWLGKVYTLTVMALVMSGMKWYGKRLPWYVWAVVATVIDMVLYHVFAAIGICQNVFVIFYPWLSVVWILFFYLSLFALVKYIRYSTVALYAAAVLVRYFLDEIWLGGNVMPFVGITVLVMVALAICVWAEE